MITEWTVSNFKSISRETTLGLAPLTIFAGPNSSGKSTFLQSMLLIGQTLARNATSRSVVLNGALARLGQFDDLRCYRSETNQITIAWECRPTEDAEFGAVDGGRLPRPPTVYGRRIDTIREVSCRLSFDASPGSPERDLFQLQPRLFLFSISVLARTDEGIDRRHELTISRARTNDRKTENLRISGPNSDALQASLEYNVVLDDESLAELRQETPFLNLAGCVLRHFLPKQLTVRVNAIEEIAGRLHEVIVGGGPRYPFRAAPREREIVIPNAVIKFLKQRLGGTYGTLFETGGSLLDVESGMPVGEWTERTRQLHSIERRRFRQTLAGYGELRQIITDAVRSEWTKGEPEYRLVALRLPDVLMDAQTYMEYLFSVSLMYLGPLRDEPKAIYPLVTSADPSDIGLRGELTAAVLNLYRDRRIRLMPSSAFARAPFDPVLVVRSLESAVSDWLKYLGVADTATSFDRGKFGHELKVTLDEDSPKQDLTHVGVGVSQVLPILVMSLLADNDTILVFEQPELHLHPRVQTRLADFFLCLALMGKQCVIETHSEYLINRLRYRAATEDKRNRVTNNLKIYFVEKIAGSSNFREVKVNEYGAILDWPEGFFDQSPREAEDILRAAMKKRRAEKEERSE